jgi:glucose-6-phosphate 1-dehydrogenase
MAWSIIDPILEYWDKHPVDTLPTYPSGSWGPEEANKLLDGDHTRWR